jgi:hypothetical protein
MTNQAVAESLGLEGDADLNDLALSAPISA